MRGRTLRCRNLVDSFLTRFRVAVKHGLFAVEELEHHATFVTYCPTSDLVQSRQAQAAEMQNRLLGVFPKTEDKATCQLNGKNEGNACDSDRDVRQALREGKESRYQKSRRPKKRERGFQCTPSFGNFLFVHYCVSDEPKTWGNKFKKTQRAYH